MHLSWVFISYIESIILYLPYIISSHYFLYVLCIITFLPYEHTSSITTTKKVFAGREERGGGGAVTAFDIRSHFGSNKTIACDKFFAPRVILSREHALLCREHAKHYVEDGCLSISVSGVDLFLGSRIR